MLLHLLRNSGTLTLFLNSGFLFVRVNVFGSLNTSQFFSLADKMQTCFWYEYCFLKVIILDTLKTNSAWNTNKLLKLKHNLL